MNTLSSSKFGSGVFAIVAFAVGFGGVAAAWGQSHGVSIGKSCLPDRCEGDKVNCSIEIGHNDGFGDSITVLEAWDTLDPGGLNIRVPAVGNLPIASVSGNTNCVVGGLLPCDICAGGSVLCPGALDPNNQGFVAFLSDDYVIQPGDPDPLFDQASVRIRDNCNGCGAPPCSGCSSVPNFVGFGAATMILQCEDNNACTKNVCVSRTAAAPGSCTFDPDCTSADDCGVPNACFVPTCVDSCCGNTPRCPGEVCCADGTPCDDGNACTDDACGPNGCCGSSPHCPSGVVCCADGTACNDGNACTDDTCGPDGCCGSSPHCPPGVACCADGTVCDDGDACTADSCVDGCCTSSPLCAAPDVCCADGTPCDDGNACTDDACGPNGCCGSSPHCPSGVVCCADGTTCEDGNACTDDACGPNGCCGSSPHCPSGVVCCADGTTCDDGNACTDDACGPNGCCGSSPHCPSGVVCCAAGTMCNDGDPCTTDTCVEGCCTYTEGACVCGDGIVGNSPGETCDPPGSAVGSAGETCRADCTYCGDGRVDPAEACDDGNEVDSDSCRNDCTDAVGGEGCTPGYWKQSHHFANWPAPYTQNMRVNVAFGVTSTNNPTLLVALSTGGGGENAFLRHAVAALLNSASGGVDYLYSTSDVIGIVQDAYDSGDFESAKNLLAAQNEQGCPLGRAAAEDGKDPRGGGRKP